MEALKTRRRRVARDGKGGFSLTARLDGCVSDSSGTSEYSSKFWTPILVQTWRTMAPKFSLSSIWESEKENHQERKLKESGNRKRDSHKTRRKRENVELYHDGSEALVAAINDADFGGPDALGQAEQLAVQDVSRSHGQLWRQPQVKSTVLRQPQQSICFS